MNIVENEAIEFAKYEFFNGEYHNTVDNLSSSLSSKLYTFKRKVDKLFFLNILRKEVLNQKIEHEKTCKTPNCGTSREKETGLFVIDQEVEEISQSYTYEPKPTEEFTPEEKSELHITLNYIKDNLNKLGLGQEIIYDEIEELKNHFNLGKKNWFQLLKGKLFDLTVSKTLEETIVKEIYGKLSKGYESLPDLIDNL